MSWCVIDTPRGVLMRSMQELADCRVQQRPERCGTPNMRWCAASDEASRMKAHVELVSVALVSCNCTIIHAAKIAPDTERAGAGIYFTRSGIPSINGVEEEPY